MSLPNSYYTKTERVSLRKISDLTYEVSLPRYGQYIHNMSLVCNPVIIDRDSTRCLVNLCFSNIQSVSLCFNNTEAITLYNTGMRDQVVNLYELYSVYSISVDFFKGWPLVTESLYRASPTIKIQFYREPTVLPQLQYEIHLVDKSWHNALQTQQIHVPRSDTNGTCYYEGGTLWM